MFMCLDLWSATPMRFSGAGGGSVKKIKIKYTIMVNNLYGL